MKLPVFFVALICFASSITAKELLERFPAPKGGITAVYKSLHGKPERLTFVDEHGREVYFQDYTESVYIPGPGQWTSSGRFFVYPLLSRYREPIFANDRFDIVDIQSRRVFVGGDLCNADTTSQFKLSRNDTITFFEVDPKGRRKSRTLSLSQRVPYVGGESFWGEPSEKELSPFYKAADRARRTGICNIHKVQMKKVLVLISWGLVVDSVGPLFSTQIRFFPHARQYVNGGCEIGLSRENEKVAIYVCPECRRAEWLWAKAHPKDPWSRERLKQRDI
jgi:hypothetical protein